MKKFILFLPIFLFANLFYQIPLDNFDINKAKLGKKMYFDTRLSPNKISCNRCHNLYLNSSGTSDLNLFGLNAPTILNAAKNYLFFYSGDIRDIKDQVIRSITSTIELGSNFKFLEDVLNNNPEYYLKFNLVFEDGINKNNIIDAFINYEKSLLTPNSKFDNFLANENYSIFSDQELSGYKLFLNLGCVYCHNGINLGSNAFGNAISGEVIKIPTLRNVTKTAPYYKNGSEPNLKEVIAQMARTKCKKEITKEDVDNLFEFLKTLEGDLIDYE